MEQQHHHLQASGLVQPPQTAPTTTDINPIPVAYSAPTPPHVNPNHPSYTEMITAAILWDSSQGKAGGSSKRAIAKYIDRVYTNLPPTHSALLTHHLKRMKNTGQLVMIKNSYQLPIVAATTTTNNTTTTNTTTTNTTVPNSPIPLRSIQVQTLPVQPVDPTPKKRPGRPPKTSPLAQPNSVNGLSSGKKPRGRPPRNQIQNQVVSEVPFVQPVLEPQAQPINYTSDLSFNNGSFQSQSPQSVKRRPGRPSKKEALNSTISNAEFQSVNEGSMAVVPVNGSVQKRRGRPPRATNTIIPSGGVSGGPKSGRRGRPKRNALGPISKSIGKKPRGRTPKKAGLTPVVGGKRRGRPPKGSVSVGPTKAKTVRKYSTGSGKPRGRPKKGASTPGQRMANEELIKTFENIQAKVKDAVNVLKPYFTDGNATDAITALQQLEDVTTMDITSSQSSKLALNAANLFDDNTTIEPQLEDTITGPVSTFPEPQANPEPPVMPYSISDTVITEAAPFYVPPNEQQAGSWMP